MNDKYTWWRMRKLVTIFILRIIEYSHVMY
jgi:hypothetical protein